MNFRRMGIVTLTWLRRADGLSVVMKAREEDPGKDLVEMEIVTVNGLSLDDERLALLEGFPQMDLEAVTRKLITSTQKPFQNAPIYSQLFCIVGWERRHCYGSDFGPSCEVSFVDWQVSHLIPPSRFFPFSPMS